MIEAFAIIAAISALFSGYSAYSTGQSQSKMYEYNAMLANQQAESKRKEAAYRAERLREQNEAIRSKQRLAFNVSGVTPQGTPTDLLMDTSKKMEMDALSILYGGESAGAGLEAQARLQRMQGANAETAGWWNAGSSLLGGATKVAGIYAMPQTVKNQDSWFGGNG